MPEITVFSADATRQIVEVVKRVLRDPSIIPLMRGAPVYARGWYLAKTDASGVTARSGDTPGSGTVTLYKHDSSENLVQQTASGNSAAVTRTAYNLSTTAVSASTYVMCVEEQITGKLYVAWEDCA